MSDKPDEDGDKKKTSHIDRPLGERLRLERDARNLSRAKLADQLNISESTLQQWEEGRTRVPAAGLWQLCKLLHTEASDIFDGLPYQVERLAEGEVRMQGAAFIQDDGRGKHVIALTKAAAKLPNDRLQIAVDLIKALKPKY